MAQTKKRAGNGGKEEQGAASVKVKDKLVRPARVCGRTRQTGPEHTPLFGCNQQPN